jgi:hypothetical protein
MIRDALILRSGVFAASRKNEMTILMVRDGATAPPHHEGASLEDRP